MMNNPVRYTDPSGHAICNDTTNECFENGKKVNLQAGDIYDPFDISDDEYAAAAAAKESLDKGLAFIKALQGTEGWWSVYMGNRYAVWEFLIALAYGYEMGSAWGNQKMQELMPQAFANKIADLTETYGTTAGLLIFLGSMETIRIRIDDVQNGVLKKGYLGEARIKTAGIWNGSLRSSDPNAPFDFANPMSGKQPKDLLKRLDAFANNCKDKVNGCDTTGLEGTLYVLASWNAFDKKWEVAVIVSYTQKMDWNNQER